ncbi:hypothetical protein T11_7884 [Trichinella zimbabwensis]|uniref:Secreted protein n=1 Tax=Trichinella zimbabwensis TaxID=268475 RepID=A0A0V1HL31_9BILA|nr:hypothetical protein T11_7884 [Trichinella zimbabwensis]
MCLESNCLLQLLISIIQYANVVSAVETKGGQSLDRPQYWRWAKSVARKVERVFIMVNNEITKASETTEFRNSPCSHVPCMPVVS